MIVFGDAMGGSVVRQEVSRKSGLYA